jgi:dTMP kinase
MGHVHQHLVQLGRDPLVLRDPGATPLGEKLRHLILDLDQDAPVPKAETLLYQAARVQMVETRIRPALQKQRWVLCDRFDSSTVAFQAFGRGLDLHAIQVVNHFVSTDLKPDLFIWLDISLDESQRRKERRMQETGAAMDRLEVEAREFQERVQMGYRHQAQQEPQRWLVLNGEHTPEQLTQATLDELRRRGWLP